MTDRIYLDYNATTPLRPEVGDVMRDIQARPHNASSVHSFGREGRKLVEQARENVATLIGANAAQVIFNAGATEGNNTVLKHFAGERVLVSAIEHPSVLEAATDAGRIPVTPEGIVDLAALETLLKADKTALVSVMLVNNETGIIQPVKEAAALAHKHGALFHCDAVQAAGRMPVDIAALGIDFMTLSAHKMGGPQGVGALVLRLCGITPTLLQGGGQEKSARAGTENVAGIAGFGKAAEMARQDLPTYADKQTALHRVLDNALSPLHIYGQNVARVSNTTLLTLPGVSSETLLMALDLEGVAVSNGSACSSGRVEPSHVLKAMSADDAAASGALRISTGWHTSAADIEHFVKIWHKIYERLTASSRRRGSDTS